MREELSDIAITYVDAYLLHMDVGKAARAIDMPRAQANGLMKDPRVQQAIREGKRRVSDRADMSIDWTVQQLVEMFKVELTDYFQFTEDGKIAGVDLFNLTEAQRKALKTFKMTKYGPVVEITDKLAILKLIGQYLGMFKEVHQLEGSLDLNNRNVPNSPEEIKAALEAMGLPTAMFDE